LTITLLGSIALNYTKKIKVIYQSLVYSVVGLKRFFIAEGPYNDLRGYIYIRKNQYV
jgi:hypothetical protein